MAEKKKIVVMGVGNVLLRDEGFGVHVARRMMEMEMPEGVEVMDMGTSAVDALNLIEGLDRLIVVDALHMEDVEPGAVFRLTPKELQPTFRGKTSLHQLELLEVLEWADLIGKVPETVIFGVIPKDFGSFGMELTPELEAKVPEVIGLVLKELGAEPRS